VATGKVVGSIFLSTDELLGVEKLAVCSSPDFINNSGLKINKDSTRDVLSRTSFTEKVLKASSPPPTVLSLGIWPSG
jgi:hypothetical protein